MGILEHSNQNRTYICCLMEKDIWVVPGTEHDYDDRERYFVMSKAQGWYLEWELNNTHLLIIKCTSQDHQKAAEETEKCIEILKQKCITIASGIAFSMKKYT